MSKFNCPRDFSVKDDCNIETKKLCKDSRLFEALKQEVDCSLDVVKQLLKNGADVNYANEDGDSCLHLALKYSNDEKIILELLESGADVNKPNKNGTTPLLVLLQTENCPESVVRLLIRYNVDVNCKDVQGEFALTVAIQNSKDHLIMQILLEAGAEFDKGSNLDNNPFLIWLLHRENCLGEMVKLLLCHGADANCEDEHGNSPLVVAILLERNEDVFRALLEGGADIHKNFHSEESPLSKLLFHSGNCTLGIVKLLLDYNASVNYVDESGHTPLDLAIICRKGEDVIRALLEKGAQMDTVNEFYNGSSLCLAFQHASNDTIKMMLDVGFSPRVCSRHGNALFCVVSREDWDLREDILGRLIAVEREDLNNHRYHQSLFCVALKAPKKMQNLDLMVTKGVSMTACQMHRSPLVCAAHGGTLTENKVKWLLEKGACMEDNGWEIMEGALGNCNYEIGAIQLLLDLPGMMDCIIKGKEGKESILHIAIKNFFWKTAAVELLLNRLSEVRAVIKGEETVLHHAVLSAAKRCNIFDGRKDEPIGLVKLVLKRGFPVNNANNFGDTPLELAIRESPFDIDKHECCYETIKQLFISGARIGEKSCDGFTILSYYLRKYNNYHINTLYRFECFKLLVKFFLLQNPHIDFEDVERFLNESKKYNTYLNEDVFRQFANDCLKELKEMESFQIGDGFTLCEFARGYYLSSKPPYNSTNVDEKNIKLKQLLGSMTQVSGDNNTIVNTSNLDQLLTILAGKEFKVYFEVFLGRLERPVLEKTLSKMNVYTLKEGTERIYLNVDVSHKISKFLSDENLLRFILAFYKPDKA